MFNLIRRISYGVIPRPDRPWEEDPTSNAPQTGRKRRLSSTERNGRDDDDQMNKKARGESATPSVADAEGSVAALAPQVDTQEVKDVTQGVKEVDLGDKGPASEAVAPSEEVAAPENIPLPDEKSGELDELASDGADALADVSGEKEELVEATKEAGDDEDAIDSVHSSSAGEAALPENNKAENQDPAAATNELTTESPFILSTVDVDTNTNTTATTKD